MYIWLLYVYNRCLLCCSFLLIFYYEFYYSFYYKATENRGKQRITEDNGTITEYREKAQKRYVSGLLKWLYHIIHECIIDLGKTCICLHLFLLINPCIFNISIISAICKKGNAENMTISQFNFDFLSLFCYTYIIEYIISISCSNEFYITNQEL